MIYAAPRNVFNGGFLCCDSELAWKYVHTGDRFGSWPLRSLDITPTCQRVTVSGRREMQYPKIQMATMILDPLRRPQHPLNGI